MTQAETGKRVKIHYTCKLDDGAIVASSRDKDPVEFILGRNQVLPGVEEAVNGMAAGESKTVCVPPQKAYGPHHEELVEDIPLDHFPDHITPEVGQRLTVDRPNGQSMTVTVKAVSDSKVYLDKNHPLADKDLTFELELLEVS
jgi:peptidylprolyl isomerase